LRYRIADDADCFAGQAAKVNRIVLVGVDVNLF
jgi:hypothetical protein